MANKINPLKANRLFILFLTIALVVGALLPLAGIPALAGLLATIVAPVLFTSAMLPALAAINAGLFMAGVCLIRAVDFGFAAWKASKIRKKSAGISLTRKDDPKEIPETSIIYTKISRLYVNKPPEWLLDKIEANPRHTIAFMLIFAIGCATTFIPLSFLGGGPAILLLGLAQISLPLVPVTAALLNGAAVLIPVLLLVVTVHLLVRLVTWCASTKNTSIEISSPTTEDGQGTDKGVKTTHPHLPGSPTLDAAASTEQDKTHPNPNGPSIT